MADNYTDLAELGIDVNDSSDSLSESFDKAAKHVESIIARIDSNETLLKLYAYYKQATVGPCDAPKPSWYDFKSKSKWEAWKKLDRMSITDAKLNYVKLVEEIDSTFDSNQSCSSSSDQWVKVSSMVKSESNDGDGKSMIIDDIREEDLVKIESYVESNDVDGLIDGLALVHYAADVGSVKVLDKLIKLGADLNKRDVDGQSALHYAASCGNLDCVKLLLENGCDRSVKDGDGNLAVDVAADDCVKELLM